MDPLLLWQYVPMADYKLPEGMVVETVRGGVVGIWRRLTVSGKDNVVPLASPEKLQSVSDSLLNAAVPPPDWGSALSALDKAVMPRLKEHNPDNPAIFIISPPHGGNAPILRQYARAKGWPEPAPPSPKQILDADNGWFESFTANSRLPWVLPALEQCWLRHDSGLGLVRHFFERLFSGALNRGIVGCDSWAWAYLKHAMALTRTDPLVAQPLDPLRLSLWFGSLARQNNENSPVFRQSDDGSHVLTPDGGMDLANNPGEAGNFLKKLAAYSRGIPGVAWALWRESLNTLPEGDYEEGRDAVVGHKGVKTLWVTPWDKMRFPNPPLLLEKIQVLVMHALLLHNGLPRDLLCRILPFSPHELDRTLNLLRVPGILELNEKKWRVSAAAYPLVRRLMNGEGYLVDEF